MKILLVSSYLPYPLHSGGHIRLYNLLKQIQKDHEVTLICEKRQHQTDVDVREVQKICKNVITVDRRKQWGYKNIFQTGFSVYPFLITGHTLAQLRDGIDQALQNEHFDLIHVETSYVLQNVPDTRIPIVLIEHNIEYLVYKRYASNAPFLLKPFLYFDVFKLKMIEEKFWYRATKVIAVSEQEKKQMNVPHSVVVPNGVDIEKFKLKDLAKRNNKKIQKILFIGDFKWIQNRDTVKWILQNIWPRIKTQLPAATLWIVGKNIPQSITSLSEEDRNVIFDTQNTMESHTIFSEADVLLSPIRVGGGTSYKILEAMASGTPVVTNKLGAEGLKAEKRDDVLVAESPEELAKAVVTVLTDDKLYATIAKNARKQIEEHYSWEKIAKQLEEVYVSVIKKNG